MKSNSKADSSTLLWWTLLVLGLIAIPARAMATDRALRKTENVLVVTLDGFRWQELFGGADDSLLDETGGVRDLPRLKKLYWRPSPWARREALLPFLWGTVARQGQVFGNPARKAATRSANGLKFSYPGYSEMFCGFADDSRIDSNAKKDNPNLSVLEFLDGRRAFRGSVTGDAEKCFLRSCFRLL